MDFIMGLPNSNGLTVIMVVVDHLTKFGHFFPLKSDYDSKKIAEVFVHNIVKLHGMPLSVVSDHDKVFTSNFWKQLFKLHGTTLAMSSAYHPQSDGQSEALNKCLEMYLQCLTFQAPSQWAKALHWAEFWYYTPYHISAAMTPFRLFTDATHLLSFTPKVALMIILITQLIQRETLLQHLQAMKFHADKKRQHFVFDIGDQALVNYSCVASPLPRFLSTKSWDSTTLDHS